MRTSTALRTLAFVAAAAVAGCASSGAAPGSGARASTPRNIISGDQLQHTNATTLYDVVERLHPEWLRAPVMGTVNVPHGTPAPTGSVYNATTTMAGETDVSVQVYLDRNLLGDASTLRNYAPTQASMLRFYTSEQAQAVFGNAGNLNGVIQIITHQP